jgi:hypothetical protein
MARNAPRLSLPGKLVFPSTHNAGHFSMLGLGDIVMPGLLLCFVMRYDAYKKAQVKKFIKNYEKITKNYEKLRKNYKKIQKNYLKNLNKIFKIFKNYPLS